jgi:DTW domain-containing protein YfiP
MFIVDYYTYVQCNLCLLSISTCLCDVIYDYFRSVHICAMLFVFNVEQCMSVQCNLGLLSIKSVENRISFPWSLTFHQQVPFPETFVFRVAVCMTSIVKKCLLPRIGLK